MWPTTQNWASRPCSTWGLRWELSSQILSVRSKLSAIYSPRLFLEDHYFSSESTRRRNRIAINKSFFEKGTCSMIKWFQQLWDFSILVTEARKRRNSARLEHGPMDVKPVLEGGKMFLKEEHRLGDRCEGGPVVRKTSNAVVLKAGSQNQHQQHLGTF